MLENQLDVVYIFSLQLRTRDQCSVFNVQLPSDCVTMININQENGQPKYLHLDSPIS